MFESRGGQGIRTLLKNHKNKRVSSNTGPDSLNNRSYQASIQRWAIISTPAKRHLMAFRWLANAGPLIVVLGSSLPLSTKKKTLSKLDKTFDFDAVSIMAYKVQVLQTMPRAYLIHRELYRR